MGIINPLLKHLYLSDDIFVLKLEITDFNFLYVKIYCIANAKQPTPRCKRGVEENCYRGYYCFQSCHCYY